MSIWTEDGVQVKANLIIALQMTKVLDFTLILKGTKVPLYNLKDDNGVNIFHELAVTLVRESLALECLKILIGEFNDRYFEEAPAIIQSMLNSPKVLDGNTPVIEAVAYNRKKILEKYIEHQGSPSIPNSVSQTCMHIAADHGFDSIIVYLHKVLNQNLNDLDVDKRAPIHLSAMNGNSNTTILLISLIKDVNIKDIEGNTPLHFAVASQSYITIKHLLIKGGDKSMLNNNNDSPLTMAIRTGGQDIIKLIVRFIKRNKTCMDKLNPFYRDRSNPKNSSKKFVFYILVYTIRSILILNSLSYQDRMAFLCVSVGLIGVNLFLFLFLSCSDPGYKEKSTMSLVELYTQYRTDFICPYCEVKKNQSTRHCFYCSRCVEDMDHHCPWIYNCVGKKNYKYFIVFIIFSILDYTYHTSVGVLIYFGILSFTPFFTVTDKRTYIGVGLTVFCGVILLFIIPILVLHFRSCCERNKEFVKPFPRDLDMSDTSSMLVTPTASSDATYQEIVVDPKTRADSMQCCAKKRKNPEGYYSLQTK